MVNVLYWLIHSNLDALNDSPLGFLRVLTFPTFQAMLAMVASFLIVMFMGRPTINWLRRQKIGDNPDFDNADLNKAMAAKAGTPTMGGILILSAIAGVTILLADLGNFFVLMSLVCLVWLGTIGAIDDWLKLTAARRSGGRQGLTGREKMACQIGIALLLGWFVWRYAGELPEVRRMYLPFLKSVAIELSLPIFLALAVAVIVGSSNAVNLTDGLDGLAAGCMVIVSIVFLVLTLIIADVRLADVLLFHHIGPAGQLGVLCGAIAGACLGFLWFNAHPASVFMGDTGSLALGGLIGFVALVIRQELILLLVGGIFVAEAMSVMMQVGYFKYTRKRFGEGRRIFKMAPLHHHFQKCGWSETQVVVRFWVIGAMLAALALATIKLR